MAVGQLTRAEQLARNEDGCTLGGMAAHTAEVGLGPVLATL